MPSTDIHSIFISGDRIYVQCFETVLGVTVNRIHLTKISKQQKINVFVRVSFLYLTSVKQWNTVLLNSKNMWTVPLAWSSNKSRSPSIQVTKEQAVIFISFYFFNISRLSNARSSVWWHTIAHDDNNVFHTGCTKIGALHSNSLCILCLQR